MNIIIPGTTLQELAYWRKGYLYQKRRWGHLQLRHPYQVAREELQKKVKLP